MRSVLLRNTSCSPMSSSMERRYCPQTVAATWHSRLSVCRISPTEDCLVISYKDRQPGAKLSFRENKGGWPDLSGSKEPKWYSLDGNDIVLTLDDAMLDRLMTSGMVITGGGTTLTRISILKVQ